MTGKGYWNAKRVVRGRAHDTQTLTAFKYAHDTRGMCFGNSVSKNSSEIRDCVRGEKMPYELQGGERRLRRSQAISPLNHRIRLKGGVEVAGTVQSRRLRRHVRQAGPAQGISRAPCSMTNLETNLSPPTSRGKFGSFPGQPSLEPDRVPSSSRKFRRLRRRLHVRESSLATCATSIQPHFIAKIRHEGMHRT